MTPNKIKKVKVINAETEELIRTGPPRGDDNEFRLIKSLFGLSRDTVVKLCFALIAGGIWYANDMSFKSTVIKYMANQDVQNKVTNDFMRNSDSFHTQSSGIRFDNGSPQDQAAFMERSRRINNLIEKNQGMVNKGG